MEVDGESIGALSNYWWACVANDYSISIALLIGLVVCVLKTWAIIHPSVRNDSIVCLWQGWFFGFPGVKKDELPKEISN